MVSSFKEIHVLQTIFKLKSEKRNKNKYNKTVSGSRIRAAVALITFDEFHRHSAQVIQHAVFKDPVSGAFNSSLKFEANNLV